MTKFNVDDTVRELESGKVPEWIVAHLRQYLESGGKQGHYFDAAFVGSSGPVTSLLLTTVGRRTGEKRQMPLFYGETTGGYVVVGSKGGADTQPAWYLNLIAQPLAEVQVGTEHHTVRARVAQGVEREQLWGQMAKLYPPYHQYQAKTQRQIPIVILERI
jgi:deazaflavin-dependent oxidoreductase (nitroreductase family)